MPVLSNSNYEQIAEQHLMHIKQKNIINCPRQESRGRRLGVPQGYPQTNYCVIPSVTEGTHTVSRPTFEPLGDSLLRSE